MFVQNFKTLSKYGQHVAVLAEKNEIVDPEYFIQAHDDSTTFDRTDFERVARAMAAGLDLDVHFVTVRGHELRDRKGNVVLAGIALIRDHHFAFVGGKKR